MRNPVWMEPQTNYRIKLSVDNLRTSAVALEIIRKIISKRKNRAKGPKNMADAIPQEYMKTEGEVHIFLKFIMLSRHQAVICLSL